MRKRSRFVPPIPLISYRDKRRLNYGTASLVVIMCGAAIAFLLTVARCTP